MIDRFWPVVCASLALAGCTVKELDEANQSQSRRPARAADAGPPTPEYGDAAGAADGRVAEAHTPDDAGAQPSTRTDAQNDAAANAQLPPSDRDASDRAAPPAALDGSVGYPPDANAPVPPSDAGGCPSVAHPLGVRGPAIPLGKLRTPGSLQARKLGPSAWLGAHRTWLSTNGVRAPATQPAGAVMDVPLASFDGNQPWLRERALEVPWQLDEGSDDLTVGSPLLALSANEAAGSGGLFAASLIRRSEGAPGGLAFVFYHPYFRAPTEVWLAELEDGARVATRAPTPLFNKPPLFAHGAYRGREYVKVFACNEFSFDPPVPADCTVARVPLDRVDQPSAYEVFEGNGIWSKDLTRGVPVISEVAGALSISWNAHLQQFLAVHAAPLSSDVLLRSAPSIEGPWSAPVHIALEPKPMPWTTNVVAHGSVVQQCDRRIIVTYWQPTVLSTEGLPYDADTMMIAIDLE